MATDSGVLETPTHVEVMTALLYKCSAAALSATMKFPKQSLSLQSVNMRSRVMPPLTSNYLGNFTWYFTVSPMGESEKELHEYVGELKKGITQLCDKGANNLEVNDWLLAVLKSRQEVEGRVWVRMADDLVKNALVLSDDREGGGIGALVTLDEPTDMTKFRQSSLLLLLWVQFLNIRVRMA
ncbi:hypothetical protein RJ639_029131 [Escallonia herrerae]|uniref:Uncharacterized protein n=1 Tax=Escallonia herrerae TaxID=1293975 RepID=A0AA89BL88_9ASTE|nr:hypothetical protein RJ639_029131 [Escallonia herrerae]